MLIFDQQKLNWWKVGLCLGLAFFMWSCAAQREPVDLEPHVNRVVLRVNTLANQIYDFENRLKFLEKWQTKVPDDIKRLADLEVKLANLEEEVQAYFIAEQEKVNLWKNFDQKYQNLQQKLEDERENHLQFQKETTKKIEELSLSLNRLVSQEEKKLEHLSSFSKPSDKGSEKAVYEDAHQIFVGGDLVKAREKFQTFLLLYPNSDLADNAQFWIGESFYKQKEYERAILEYEKVIQKYSQGSKVPSALLKQGFAFYALDQIEEAEILFDRVIKEAPRSEQAEIAKKKLEAMANSKKSTH